MQEVSELESRVSSATAANEALEDERRAAAIESRAARKALEGQRGARLALKEVSRRRMTPRCVLA